MKSRLSNSGSASLTCRIIRLSLDGVLLSTLFLRVRWPESPISVPKTPSTFHPAWTTKRFPSSRCASAIQIVRASQVKAETQPYERAQDALRHTAQCDRISLMNTTTLAQFETRLHRIERQNRILLALLCATIGLALLGAIKGSSNVITENRGTLP